MTQIATAPPTPPPAAPELPASPRRAARTHYFAGTPGRMRILAAVASLVCVGFALAGLFGLSAVDDSVSRASANTQQVARVQSVYVDLRQAHAAVSNGFLVGGLESAELRQTYDDAMDRVARNVAAAAQAQPADGEALAALNAAVQDYAGDIDRARTYNRMTFPIGATYLDQGRATLADDVRLLIDNLVAANEERADEEFAFSSSGGMVIGAGVLALGVIVAIGLWLARRTHRWVNLPLAGAGLLVAAGLALSVAHVTNVAGTMNTVRTGDFDAAVALADARAAAFDAKANESLSLIKRGQGGPPEEAFQVAAETTRAALIASRDADPEGRDLRAAFDAYVVLHDEIRATDVDGDWGGAVELATSAEAGSANAVFNEFVTLSATELDAQINQVVTTFRGIGQSPLPWLIGIGGAVAAVLAGRSMSKRIEEYR